MARELGLRLEEQIPVFDGDRLVTTFDAGLPEEKIGYMFDGTHHWGKAQRVKPWAGCRCGSPTSA